MYSHYPGCTTPVVVSFLRRVKLKFDRFCNYQSNFSHPCFHLTGLLTWRYGIVSVQSRSTDLGYFLAQERLLSGALSVTIDDRGTDLLNKAKCQVSHPANTSFYISH